MKKFLKFSLISILIVTAAFAVFKVSNKYRVSILKDNIECTVVTKGCEKAKGLTVDDNGYIYIGYSDSIKQIDNEGKEKLLYRNKDLEIEDLSYNEDKIYYISKNMIQSYSLKDSNVETILFNVPKSGNGIERKLLSKDGELYISIGTVTNSGISENNEVDLSPIEVTLNGVNYGDTGAFKIKGEVSQEGENIKKSAVGNGAVYKINLKTKDTILYSSGIRGITGLDYNSNDEIIAIFTGMKNEGLRPINRDKDYIYKLEKDKWYGWPDFSGGDSINSPRFKGEELVRQLIKNPPSKVVPGPIYQSKSLDSLHEMAIDRKGTVLSKDSIVFLDQNEKTISALSNDYIYYRILKLKDESNISDIVYNKDELLILDNKLGCIYSIHEKGGLLGFKLPTIVWAFIFLLTILLLIVIVLKFVNIKKREK